MSLFSRPKSDYSLELSVTAFLFLVVVLLGLCSGCLAPTPGPVTPDDPDEPIVNPEPATPREAAAGFGTDLSARLSATSADLASRAAAGEFASLAELNDEWVSRVAADIDASKRLVVASMNEELLDETGEQPGAVAAGLFRQLATGFREGVTNAER